MHPGAFLRDARHRAGLTQRQLAQRCGTSHSTVAAYESGRKVPSATTLARLLHGAGLTPTVELTRRPDGGDSAARGRELIDALDLADMFPVSRPRELHAPLWPNRAARLSATPTSEKAG